MSSDSDIFLRATADERLAQEWELVLLAQGLSPSLRRSQSMNILSVPQGEVDRARAGLLAYESETHQKLADPYEPVVSSSSVEVSVLYSHPHSGIFRRHRRIESDNILVRARQRRRSQDN